MNRLKQYKRKTKETDIELFLNLDGSQQIEINTGVGFFDHMLTLFAFHAGFDLKIDVKGDLNVDDHHTIEDVGIALGQTFYELTKDKTGLNRYADSFVPMDEALARVVIDLSNRPYLVMDYHPQREKVGQMDTQNVREFFKAFTTEARITAHFLVLYGQNDHHMIEALFKALGRALKQAIIKTSDVLLSTKGVL